MNYSYASGVPTWYQWYGNTRSFNCGSFTDVETYTRDLYKDLSVLSPGNNGLYYTEVTETVSGKGARKYSFFTPDYHLDQAFPYWLCGKPRYTLSLDKDGHLRQVLVYQYYTDTFVGDTTTMEQNPYLSDGFTFNRPECCNRNSLPQLKGDDRYMNRADLESHFRSEENLMLNNTVYYRPYEDFYLVNIEPRIPTVSDSGPYRLLYGGATLLRGMMEYRVEEDVTPEGWQMDPDLRPYAQTVYHYDNLTEHVTPTRIVQYDSKGDSTVTHFKRVADMAASASEHIARMKELNAVSPVVKQTVVKDGRLLKESVSEYRTETAHGKRFYGVIRQSVYAPENAVSVTSVNDSPYSYAASHYTTETACEYDSIGGTHYLPVEVEGKDSRTAYRYDGTNRRLLVKAEDCEKTQITAAACAPYAAAALAYAEAQVHLNRVEGNAQLVSDAFRFMQDVKAMEAGEQPLYGYEEFRQTEGAQWSYRFLELLSLSDSWEASYTEEALELLDSLETQFYHLDDFIAWNMNICGMWQDNSTEPTPYDMTPEEISQFGARIMDMLVNNSNALRQHFGSLDALLQGYPQPEPLTVQSEGCTQWKLYALAPTGTHTLTYKAGGTSHSLPVQAAASTPLVVKDIQLSSGTGTLELTGVGNTDFVVLVPAGTTFEATHYDNLGRVAAKFDQSLNLEQYQYDAAGRQTKVTDQGGKTVMENSYNTLNE